MAAWLAEACVRYAGRSMLVSSIESSPVMFPFTLGGATSYLLSRSEMIEIRVDGAGNQVAGIVN